MSISFRVGMIAFLAIAALLVVWGVLRRSRLVSSKLDLDDLLLGEDSKLSKSAVVMLGSFALTSWIAVYLTLTGKMTEGFLVIYGGLWITPTVTRLIVNSPPTVQTSETETSTSSRTTIG